MLYLAYVQPMKRRVLAEADIPLERAIDFLNETPSGVISDGTRDYTREELENVKSFGTKTGNREDSPAPRRESLFEDPDRELPEFVRDNSKSRSKRNNKRDKQS